MNDAVGKVNILNNFTGTMIPNTKKSLELKSSKRHEGGIPLGSNMRNSAASLPKNHRNKA
jgi:hypothetical protein